VLRNSSTSREECNYETEVYGNRRIRGEGGKTANPEMYADGRIDIMWVSPAGQSKRVGNRRREVPAEGNSDTNPADGGNSDISSVLNTSKCRLKWFMIVYQHA
jgi:hypothetical protein